MPLIQKTLLFIFIFSLPIQKRITLFTLSQNHFNEWSTAYLYVNDIIFLMLLISVIIPFIIKKITHRAQLIAHPSLSREAGMARAQRPSSRLQYLFVFQLFFIFLLLSNFDHYFWSLHNGALLFWLTSSLAYFFTPSLARGGAQPLITSKQIRQNQKKYSNFLRFIIHNLQKIKNSVYFITKYIVCLKQTIIIHQKKINPILFIQIIILLYYFLCLFIQDNSFKNYQIYSTLRLALYFTFFWAAIYFLKKYQKTILYSFLCSSFFQSIVAILQFAQQKSLGLKILAESPLNLASIGIAKININNIPIIRSYGTVGHPNILSAYLLVSLIIIFYLIYSSSSISQPHSKQSRAVDWIKEYSLIFIGLINLSALFFTFSRIAYLTLSLIMVSCFLFFKKLSNAFKKNLIIISIFIFLIIILNFKILAQRFSLNQNIKKNTTEIFKVEKSPQEYSSASKNSALKKIAQNSKTDFCFLISQEKTVCFSQTINPKNPQLVFRLKGIQIAFNIIKTHPFFGKGHGLFVLKMQNYFPANLDQWELQPAHNLFLLQSAESGLAGFVLLNFLTLQIFKPWRIFKYKK